MSLRSRTDAHWFLFVYVLCLSAFLSESAVKFHDCMWWRFNLTGKWRGSREVQVWGLVGGRLNLLSYITCQLGTWRYLKGYAPVGFFSVEIRDEAHDWFFCIAFQISPSVFNSAGFPGPGLLYSWRSGWIVGQSLGKTSWVSSLGSWERADISVILLLMLIDGHKSNQGYFSLHEVYIHEVPGTSFGSNYV